MRVEVPLGVFGAVRGALVEPHAVREGNLKQAVVTRRHPLQDIGEPKVSGNTAQVLCRVAITTSQPRRTTVQPALLNMELRNGRWIILNLTVQKE